MTKQERIIISAYTGYLMCNFNDVHKYIEEKLGMPIWTHELADKAVQNRIREAMRADFLALCSNEEDK